jgi:hypothetical protein
MSSEANIFVIEEGKKWEAHPLVSRGRLEEDLAERRVEKKIFFCHIGAKNYHLFAPIIIKNHKGKLKIYAKNFM